MVARHCLFRLCLAVYVVVWFFAIDARNVLAIGGRHTVAEAEYIKLANNQGKFKAGKAYPDFSPVCVLGRFGNDDQWHGTGVLIAPQWVLTAAHVALREDDARRFEDVLKVRFGSSAKKFTSEYKVTDMFTPLPLGGGAYDWFVNKGKKQFSREERMKADMNDIALLKLSQPVKNIKPAELFEGNPKLGAQLFLVGFGAYAPGTQPDESKWDDNGVKRAAENTLDRDGHHDTAGLIAFDFDNGHRKRNSLLSNRYLDNELRTMLGKGESSRTPLPLEGSSYPGDSGGPAFCAENGRWRVLGIAAFGTEYPLTGSRHYVQYGDVLCYTRVPSHLTWIRGTMARWRGNRGK